MNSEQLILKYFPDISEIQKDQFSKLLSIYTEWNNQINVISRKDTDNFYERHVLHSLGIAKIQKFEDNSDILDIGTGGGFPGIPLAILYPNCNFLLVDSIGKKIKVVQEVAKTLNLTNVTAIHERAENIDQQFDFIVSRAVTAMPAFLKWTKDKFKKKSVHDLKNGILYLKGGDLTEEMKGVKKFYKTYDLKNIFEEVFFDTKKVVYVRH
ncbi:MAG: 16S rRNA (guanine(527)-N(7))-methyltransferase RsmG [Crocinitomicaceae bacterium]